MIGIIIQARTKSNRFPRKIYEDICGKYTLQRVISGSFDSKIPHKIILAMPEYDREEFLQRESKGDFDDNVDERFRTFFGHPDDLVDRYFNAARQNGIDLIVRVTADCPLLQGNIIDEMLRDYLRNGSNGFMGNNNLVSDVPYPAGIDVGIFPYWMLSDVNQVTKDLFFREHVTPFMYRNGTNYNIYPFRNQAPNTVVSTRFSDLSFDTDEDHKLISSIALGYDKHKDLNKAINAVDI